MSGSSNLRVIKRMLLGIEYTVLGIAIGGGAILYEFPAGLFIAIPFLIVGFIESVLGSRGRSRAS